jgi:hypothetical protein
MKRMLLVGIIASFAMCVQASAKDIQVKSWCPMTGAVGLGRGATFEAAKDAAIKACLNKGGQSACCNKFYRQI